MRRVQFSPLRVVSLISFTSAYTMSLFYALAAFLKKMGVNQKGVNKKWYAHKKKA
jgi:hypothetical protein